MTNIGKLGRHIVDSDRIAEYADTQGLRSLLLLPSKAMNNQRPEYEQVFDDFWKEIVCNEKGELDPDKVKRELFDYWVAIENVPKVYSEITGGNFSKLNTDYIHVVQAATEHYSRVYQSEQTTGYAVPDPAWDYCTVWQQVTAAHAALEKLMQYMTTEACEQATLGSDNSIDRILNEAHVAIIRADDLLPSKEDSQEQITLN